MAEWVELDDLEPGTLFETKSGSRAVKSEYHYGNEADSQWECILLDTGEAAHFAEKNQTLVRELILPRESSEVLPEPECDHLWMRSSAGNYVIGESTLWEYFYCQRNPTHRLTLVDGKVSG
jgi:hypothetical protein